MDKEVWGKGFSWLVLLLEVVLNFLLNICLGYPYNSIGISLTSSIFCL